MKSSLFFLFLISFSSVAIAINDEDIRYVEFPNGTTYWPLNKNGDPGSTVATESEYADCAEKPKRCRELLEEAYESGEPVTKNPGKDDEKKKKKKASAQIAAMSDNRIRSLSINHIMKLPGKKKRKTGNKRMLKRYVKDLK